MDVSIHAVVILLSDDEQQLRVSFQAAQSVDDETTRSLQLLRLSKVVFFIETCLHLEQDGDVLACFRRLE